MFRVLFFPALEQGGEPFKQEFLTLDQAKTAKDTIANYTLMLHEQSLMPDYSNMAIIEQCVNGEWVDVEELD